MSVQTTALKSPKCTRNIGHHVPIGNFFSNLELFYLTHIHENRAQIIGDFRSDFGCFPGQTYGGASGGLYHLWQSTTTQRELQISKGSLNTSKYIWHKSRTSPRPRKQREWRNEGKCQKVGLVLNKAGAITGIGGLFNIYSDWAQQSQAPPISTTWARPEAWRLELSRVTASSDEDKSSPTPYTRIK
jgi:hypothetical protein